jgi:ATP-dependent exoDNAse (exonuclease V) beta subunit
MSDKTLNETAAQQQSNDNANDSDATEKMTIYRFDRSEASLKNIAYVSYRPSDFEHGRKRKSNTKAVKWKRPKGTEFGTTMHRSLELLLNRMMHLEECNREQQLDKMVTACVHQAMNEEKNDIASAEVEDYKAILPEMLKAYWSWLSQTDYLKGVKAIHTELPFSYLKTIEDIKSENAEYLREKLKKDELEEVPVWVNGTADLLFLYEDGTALVLDYKSDTIGGLELEQFREDLKKAYGGQLDMYRYAIQKLYDIPLDKITTKLVYFYEKDQQIIVEDVEKEHN